MLVWAADAARLQDAQERAAEDAEWRKNASANLERLAASVS